ncbi:MAG: hypothetical protein ACLFRX_05785, partial [Gemmatimonadota bacterium]
MLRLTTLGLSAILVLPTALDASGPGEESTLGSNLSPVVTAIDAGDPVDHVLYRGDCMNAAAASAGAIVCGDLQVAHALPAIRSMNRVRGLSLLYTSDHGRPHVIVNADVTLPSTANVPDSVVGVLYLTPHGGVRQQVGRQKWYGYTWSPGATRRVAVSGDWLKSTGIYDYTLEVFNYYGATGKKASISGQRIVVDRRTSPYGTGWWLSGIEQIIEQPDGSLLWVGGDGSARRYASHDSGVYLGKNRSRRDTITFNGSEYVRHVPGKIRVYFDGAGRHVRTTDAAGLTTRFYYNSYGGVYQINLPSGSSTKRVYLNYSSGKLYRVNVLNRYVNTTIDGSGLLTSIQDPDGTSVGFGYSNGRMTRRTNRRGYNTYYYYDVAKRISRVRLDMPYPEPDINTYFRIQRSQGRAISGTYGPVSPTSAHTYLDGPRSVADIHRFYENAHGQPWKVQDAIGAVTEVQRNDTRWPALVTWSRAPSGQVVTSTYDDGGRVTVVEDRSMPNSLFRSNGSTYARTTYEWDEACAMPSKITRPMGDYIEQDYTAQCRVWWRRDNLEASSETRFSYDSSGRPDSVQPPEDSATFFEYHSDSGNLKAVRDHLGNETRHYQDQWGRDTLVVTPVDGIRSRRIKTVYDAAGRDSIVTTIGDETRYSWSSPEYRDVLVTSDTMWVRTLYDDEGNLVSVRRSGYERPEGGGGSGTDTVAYWTIPLQVTEYRYDAADREVWSSAGVTADSSVYDAAGNVTVKINRSRYPIEMEYDPMGRMIRRIAPEVRYPRTCLNESITLCSFYYYPQYPNDGDGLLVPADTSVFAYDLSGNLISAANAVGRVNRSYFPNGLLKADTLRIATWATGSGDDDDPCADPMGCVEPLGFGLEAGAETLSTTALPGNEGDFSSHIYVLGYTYDQNGRTATITYPAETSVGTVTYDYHTWGPLQSVSASGGGSSHIFGFEYDNENRMIRKLYPGSGVDAVTYDGLGRVHTRNNATSSKTIHTETYTADLL